MAPELFDYSQLLSSPPWNAPSGSYTRYGSVEELLQRADNRLVVMAPGDEMTVSFDAGELPPLPRGWRRDFVLHFTGWAKDMDPNTLFSGTVAPLPALDMKEYSFMSRIEHETRSFDSLNYQTRSVPLLVAPLAPLDADP